MVLNQKYYTIPEVAKLLGLTRIAVWRWVNKGLVKAFRPHPSVILISKAEVHRMAKERGLL